MVVAVGRAPDHRRDIIRVRVAAGGTHQNGLVPQSLRRRGNGEAISRFREGQTVAVGIRKIIVDRVVAVGQNDLV